MAEHTLTEAERETLLDVLRDVLAAVESILAARRPKETTTPRPEGCHCDYNPATTDGPEEDCPRHGRPYAYWVERSDDLAARLARVEELCDDAERVKASHDRALRRMDPDHRPCESTARARFARRIRAALAPVEPATEEADRG